MLVRPLWGAANRRQLVQCPCRSSTNRLAHQIAEVALSGSLSFRSHLLELELLFRFGNLFGRALWSMGVAFKRPGASSLSIHILSIAMGAMLTTACFLFLCIRLIVACLRVEAALVPRWSLKCRALTWSFIPILACPYRSLTCHRTAR